MKKIYVLIIGIFLLLVSSIIVIIISKNDNSLVYTTFRKSYSYVSKIDEEEDIVIIIDVNNKDSFLIREEAINSCYISDKQENNKRKLKLNKIEYYRQIEIDEEIYYEYKFSFSFPIDAEIEEDFIIDEAFLILNFSDDSISLYIGDFNYYKVSKIQDSSNIRISKIKGIVNVVDERKRVVGLNVKVENISSKDLKITELNIFNENLNFDGEEVKILETEIVHNKDISELVSDYNYLDSFSKTNNLNIIINANSSLDLFIPIVYIKDIVCNEFGFAIDFLFGEEKETYIYDDFIFFENIFYEEKQINDLNLYYYERN